MRREPASRHGVYRHLLERKRVTVERYGHLQGNPYLRQLAELEAGEPVEVHAWQLPGEPGDYGMRSWERARVTSDDRVEIVRRVEATGT